jgi:hypothetical protein
MGLVRVAAKVGWEGKMEVKSSSVGMRVGGIFDKVWFFCPSFF